MPNESASKEWSLGGLGADGPDPKLREKLMLFGQFVGDWDIVDARFVQADGTWVKMKGEVHFAWILEGTAVQDVWIGRRQDTLQLVVHGTTLRFYDPKIDSWRSTWISPLRNLVKPFIAKMVGDEIVLESKLAGANPEKWIFSEITPRSFRWRAEESRDNGKTWVLTEEMRIRRTE